MDLRSLLVLFVLLEYSYCDFTDWTVLLWLSSYGEDEPYLVWNNSSSSYNNDTTLTTSELSGTRAYRNVLIDTWTNHPPHKIKVSYRNKDGMTIYSVLFNSTGLTNTQWFTAAKEVSGELSDDWTRNTTQIFTRKERLQNPHSTSLGHMAALQLVLVDEDPRYPFEQYFRYHYSVDFSISDNSSGVERYKTGSVKLSNGTVVHIVGAGDTIAALPASPVDAADCYASYLALNPLAFSMSVSNLTHIYCSAICRERNYPYGAVHGTTCSCLEAPPIGGALSICTVPCEGDINEMCGGTQPPAVIFNYINTDIDASHFDKPLVLKETIEVTGTSEATYLRMRHVYGFNISIAQGHLPVTIDMVLNYRNEMCNGTYKLNRTINKTFSVASADQFYILEMEPIRIQCVNIHLYDATTSTTLTFNVAMTSLALEENNFAMANTLVIEGAWKIDESNDCECECWVYNMLYGDSPYTNLSYEQIEVALKNTTEKLEKELAVNVSSLSSTIRQKTSADDSRPSAAVVGYTLGVALLVLTFGGIVLSDAPKMLGSMNIMRTNLMSRFVKQPVPNPPDVTLIANSNH